MAGFGYGGYGVPYGGVGGFNNVQQVYEQERVGYGPQGYAIVACSPLMNLLVCLCRYGLYEQEVAVNRNPYTGATSVVRESEFVPMGGTGYGGYGGYGAPYGNRFY